MTTVENMQALGPRCFVVWTQAGFKKAVRLLHRLQGDDDPAEGYPTQYPSVVEFIPQYRGHHYWHVDCTPLSKEIAHRRRMLTQLENLDAQHTKALTERNK